MKALPLLVTMLGWLPLCSFSEDARSAASMTAAAFRGINWADGRDNFVDGWIIPSGINHRLSQEEISVQARELLTEMKRHLPINTVRLGINPATVLDETWWPKYKAIVQKATALDVKVLLACWESKSSKDGKIDDHEAFIRMWDQVVRDYASTPNIFLEIMNEPHGYSDEEWRDIAAEWVDRYAAELNGGRKRIFISGSGYNERVTGIAADPRFQDCWMSFHLYAWFGGKHRSSAGWKQELVERIGQENAARTVVTEWGATMSNVPQDHYSIPMKDGDRNQAYLTGMAESIRSWGMGSLYWPGLRDGDPFSLLTRKKESTTLSLTNLSGKKVLLNSFGLNPVENK